jgi:hypothetical protein
MTKQKTTDANGNEYDGLYNMPKDFLAAIGGDLNPPLIDPASGSFENASSAVAEAIRRNQRRDSEIVQALASLKKEKANCEGKVGDSLAQIANQRLGALVGTCAVSDNWCTGGGKSALLELQSNLSGVIVGDDDTYATMDASLSTGIGKCKEANSNFTEAEQVKREKEQAYGDCVKIAQDQKKNIYTECAQPKSELTEATKEYDRFKQQRDIPLTCDQLTVRTKSAMKDVIDNTSQGDDAGEAH